MNRNLLACAVLVGALGLAIAAQATNLDSLIQAAKKEGQLTTIALPHDWCGYGAMLADFSAKYGIKINELNPDAGSGDEIEAIKANKGNPAVQVVVPKSGVVAGVYVQAISKYAPHPSAARLWMEYLYSDAGQLGWLKGYCHPIRFNDLAAKKKIPAEMLARLPSPALYKKAVFPTLQDQETYKAAITKQWDGVVGSNVK